MRFYQGVIVYKYVVKIILTLVKKHLLLAIYSFVSPIGWIGGIKFNYIAVI